MEYLIKTSALLLLFYLGYRLLLQKETFFKSNRVYLLLGMVTSFLLPYIVIPIYKTRTLIAHTVKTASPMQPHDIKNVTPNPTVDLEHILITLYIVGIVIFSIRFLIQLTSIARLINSGKKNSDDGFTLIETHKTVAPLSFFKFIIINPKTLNDHDKKQVLAHEKAHVTDWHSIDVIISELGVIFCWFNPVAWLYQSAIKQNIEFLADRSSIEQVECSKTYQKVLVNHSIPNYRLAITNNFHNSFLKKRIVMLNKSKSQPLKKIKLFVVLPALALFLYSFNTETRYITKIVKAEAKVQNTDTSSIEVFFTKTTTDAELNKIKKRLSDQQVEMIIKKLERNSNNEIITIDVDFKTETGSANYNVMTPKGIAPFYFKMEEDGSFGVSSVDTREVFYKKYSNVNGDSILHKPGNKVMIYKTDSGKLVKLDSSNTTAYRIRSIQDSTDMKWISIESDSSNGSNLRTLKTKENVFIMSIDSSEIENLKNLKTDFYFENDINVKVTDPNVNYMYTEDYIIPSGKSVYIKKEDQPMVIIDNKVVDYSVLQSLKPEQIKSLSVLKDATAVSTYGKAAKNGVLFISTKKKTKWVSEQELKADGKWAYTVSSVSFSDDKEHLNLAYISKHSTDDVLEKHKADLESQGIKVKYSKLKRNSKGEIVRIKISLKNSEGDESSATYKSDDGIVGVHFGLLDGKLVVTSSPI